MVVARDFPLAVDTRDRQLAALSPKLGPLQKAQRRDIRTRNDEALVGDEIALRFGLLWGNYTPLVARGGVVVHCRHRNEVALAKCTNLEKLIGSTQSATIFALDAIHDGEASFLSPASVLSK